MTDDIVPVKADNGQIEVGFIDKPDPLFNGIGLKALREVSMSGAAMAVGDAIFHATRKRICESPVRIGHLLRSATEELR